jgi:hypothetical protein
MAVRASMADLIARLRVLVGDPVSATKTFEDQALQDELDARRTDVVEAALRARPSFGSGNTTVFVDYFAPRRQWEDNVVLYDVHGAVLTPTGADLVAGHWTFAAGQPYPVFITGSFYDLYGTASAVLEAWAAISARDFDFTMNAGPTQQTFNRSQKTDGLLKVAAELARRAIPPGPRPAWRSSDW